MISDMSRAAMAMFFVAAGAAMAQQPGVFATEIKLGQTVPFSGPVSVAGVVGHASVAYFGAVNKAGGINGRPVKLIVLDDGYSPPKTVEATRRLVQDDNVLMMYGSVGTPTNAVVEKYLNLKKVPQLFITTGQAPSGTPKHFPGPWRSCLATHRKAGRWRATSSMPSPHPGSRYFTRMTISARISGRASGPASVAMRTPLSSASRPLKSRTRRLIRS